MKAPEGALTLEGGLVAGKGVGKRSASAVSGASPGGCIKGKFVWNAPFPVLFIAGLLALLVAGCALEPPSPGPGPGGKTANTLTPAGREPSTPVPPATVPDPTTAVSGAGEASTLQTGEWSFELAVREVPSGLPSYDRGDWPHWSDEDRDCQDTRQEALIAESEIPVSYKTENRCRVESGIWKDPYTNLTVHDPGDLDVDHLVPLANAHRSGAWAWSREQKKAYANDLSNPEHLLAVTASANRSKGRKGPEEWRPDNEGYWCEYARDWAGIKIRWNLSVTPEELDALQEMASTCSGDMGISEGPSSDLINSSQPNREPSATPADSASERPQYDPDGPDRDCGDFETWQASQEFFVAAGGPERDRHRLDRDYNGIACESLPGAP